MVDGRKYSRNYQDSKTYPINLDSEADALMRRDRRALDNTGAGFQSILESVRNTPKDPLLAKLFEAIDTLPIEE